MAIMIIFIVLSLVLIVGTAIYLNIKKKGTNREIKQVINTNTKEKSKKKTKKQLADILEIKIKDNMIRLGNRYSAVVRLGNIDYNMLSNSEQDAIENILIQTALAIDYPVQFFSTTEYVDTSKIIDLIKQNKTKSNKIQEYKENITKYLENLMENKTISVVKNYAIISYDGLYENAIDELNRKTNLFKSNLLRAKIICEILTEDELYNLIYRELNKNSALTISNLKKGGENLYVGKVQKTKNKRN